MHKRTSTFRPFRLGRDEAAFTPLLDNTIDLGDMAPTISSHAAETNTDRAATSTSEVNIIAADHLYLVYLTDMVLIRIMRGSLVLMHL